ncbi:hypothetical protein VUR80DRAFT_7181 [Thermomyces stellatus]
MFGRGEATGVRSLRGTDLGPGLCVDACGPALRSSRRTGHRTTATQSLKRAGVERDGFPGVLGFGMMRREAPSCTCERYSHRVSLRDVPGRLGRMGSLTSSDARALAPALTAPGKPNPMRDMRSLLATRQ